MGKGGPKGKSGPCKFFSTPQGCSNGQSCPFIHGAAAAGTSAPAPSAKGGNKGNLPCKFFGSSRGCTNDTCPFRHGSANASFSQYKAAARPASESVGKPAGQTLPSEAQPDNTAEQDPDGPCKFFGSAKGCSNETCAFSHGNPNSVPPCSFKQRLGSCEKGDACTFRHQPWGSPDEARAHYAAREGGVVEQSTKRFKQLHRDDLKQPDKIGKEHVETEFITVEREMQVETYGANAVKMMEKMGYKAGSGLGKDEQGSARLSKQMTSLEAASQNSALGFGIFAGSVKATVAERTARLATARAGSSQRVDETAFLVNQLLSEDESSDDDEHIKARDIQLKARPA